MSTVLLDGWYGKRNTGDDAFCLVGALRYGRRMPPSQVAVLADARGVPELPSGVRAVTYEPRARRIRGLRRATAMLTVARAGAVVHLGGSRFDRPTTVAMRDQVLLARSGVVRLHAQAVSIGPFHDAAAARSQAAFLSQSERSWRRHIDLNLTSVLAGVSAAAPVMAMVKQILPFVTVSVWLVVIIANAVVGQKLLVRMGRAQRPSPDLSATRLPGFMAPAAVAAAALALVSSGWLGFVATNVALILCVPFFLTGLAVLHAVSARWNGRTVILVATYLLLLLFGWPLIVVAGLGFMEHWVGLRDKLAGPGPAGPGGGAVRPPGGRRAPAATAAAAGGARRCRPRPRTTPGSCCRGSRRSGSPR